METSLPYERARESLYREITTRVSSVRQPADARKIEDWLRTELDTRIGIPLSAPSPELIRGASDTAEGIDEESVTPEAMRLVIRSRLYSLVNERIVLMTEDDRNADAPRSTATAEKRRVMETAGAF